tara:strand:+ start:746 stop:1162 length:417 start_codon:yes stop_codon:yes gene_type:complete
VIKLNGKRYFNCNEITEVALQEITNVFDQYSDKSTPYPPISGILQMSVEQKEMICSITNELKIKLENYYCDANENCCNTQTILKFLSECKMCDSDTITYSKYNELKQLGVDCNESNSKFYNFLQNVCIELAERKISNL